MQGQVVDVPQTDGTSHSGQVEAEDLVLEIGSDDAWRALGSPYRMRLFELIRRSGTITITELAPLAGTNPVNLYYHVHTLQNAGLIKTAGHRPGVARRAPKTYMANGNRMVVRYDPRNEMAMKKVVNVAEAAKIANNVARMQSEKAKVDQALAALQRGPLDAEEVAWMQRVGDHIYGADRSSGLRDGAGATAG